jgi:RND family efflux transporter MFP subunit
LDVKRQLSLFVLPALLLLVSGCEDEGPDIDVESSIPVRVEQVSAKAIEEYALATGTVHAAHEARLLAQQSGYYRLQINPRTGESYAMGDRVYQGESIVILANPEFENEVSIESKKLNFEISEREFTKQQNLYEKGGITLRELTDAERTFINARYSYDNAKLQLLKLRTMAPFDGIIVDLPYYTPREFVGAGSLLAQVMDYSRLHAEVTLPGKEMSRVERGQRALVSGYAEEADTLIGTVTQVSPALDPESRMFKLSLAIDNDSLRFKPGMFVKVHIVVAAKDSTLVIPKDVILERRGAKTVFVVDKGIAVERRLETGLANRREIEVLSGLQEDDRLVVEGFETLRHRAKVKITK